MIAAGILSLAPHHLGGQRPVVKDVVPHECHGLPIENPLLKQVLLQFGDLDLPVIGLRVLVQDGSTPL